MIDTLYANILDTDNVTDNDTDDISYKDKYKILTVDDVSAILKISKCNTYKLFNSRLFPSYRINNKLFITEEAFQKWFSKLENKSIEL